MYCENCVEYVQEFDVREMWLDWREEWEQDRKDLFLVRQDDDIQTPLSADVSVWESVFDLAPEISRPSNMYPSPDNLDEIKKRLAPWNEQRCYWLIAVSIVLSDTEPIQYSNEPINPSWQLLGYDICAGESFLMNAGWGEDEVPLKEHLRPLLNAYHLFPDLETANTSWQRIHDRESPHGPFTINGLYLIEEFNAT